MITDDPRRPHQPARVDTDGGAVFQGDVQAGRDVIGRDKIEVTVSADSRYDVAGLENPYLGLRAFTYDDRDRFAGRQGEIRRAVEILATPGEERTLLFITGASGSGKSSLAQAGLLPALEHHHRARRGLPRVAVFRPSRKPLAMLADALTQLGLRVPRATDGDPQAAIRTPAAFAATVQAETPPDHVNLLVIDQFEEVFTQAEGTQRDALVAILSALPPFAMLRTHVIVTVRSDYLGQLFEVPALDAVAGEGIKLREMAKDELQLSIHRPLQAWAQVRPSHAAKSWEASLVDELAHATAASAAYLPLLQVTLQEIWKRGSLTLGAYHAMGSTLTDAIRQRATAVYEYADYDAGVPMVPRPEADQEAMLAIFLDLVDVSADGSTRADVRRRRSLTDLVGGASSPTAARRAPLIEDLTRARLLSTHTEAGEVYVDLIHESLIANWDRLDQEIDAERQLLRQRARFEQALKEWLGAIKAEDYLLTGVRLAEARELLARGDVALRGTAAREALDRSVAQQEESQQRELEQARALATEQQRRAVAERQRADDQRQSARQARLLSAGLGVLLLLAISLSAFAFVLQGRAERQSKVATSRQLAAQASTYLDQQLDLSLLLSVQASRVATTVEARSSLLDGLHHNPGLITFLRGHTGAVWSVAFSPDGEMLASGGEDGTIRLWDVASQTQLGAHLAGHTDAVRSAVVGPEGPRPGNPGAVRSVAFSPDGEMLASGGADGTVRLWDVASHRQRGAHLAGHTNGVYSVVFSPDGETLASAGEDKTIRLWDVASQTQRGTTLNTTRGVRSVAFSPDGETLASGGDDRAIRLWDVVSQTQRGAFLAGNYGAVRSVAFSPDGKTLVSASDDGPIRLWDVVSQTQRGDPLTSNTDMVLSVAFSPDGKTVASAVHDKGVRLWDVASRRPFDAPLTDHINKVYSVAFRPDSKTLASAGDDGIIRLWDAASQAQRGAALPGHRDSVYSVAFSPDGKTLASGGDDGTIQLWDVASQAQRGTPLTTERGIESSGAARVRSLAFSPDGKTLASGGDDRTIRLWDVASQAQRGIPLTGHTNGVHSVAFSPDGKTLVSGGHDGTIRLWDVANQTQRGTPLNTSGVQSVAFSPDGKTLASGGAGGTVRLWDVANQTQRGTPLNTSGVQSVAFSPDGKTLASGGAGGTVRLWDVASQAPRGTPLTGDTNGVQSVAFSPDGETLASGGDKGVILLRDVASHRQLGASLTGHPTVVHSVAFSPDGKTLSSAGYRGVVLLSDTDLVSWRARACRLANRNLTQSEWVQFVGDTPYEKSCPDLPTG